MSTTLQRRFVYPELSPKGKPYLQDGLQTFVVGYIEEFWTVVSAVFPGMADEGN